MICTFIYVYIFFLNLWLWIINPFYAFYKIFYTQKIIGYDSLYMCIDKAMQSRFWIISGVISTMKGN